MQTPKGDVSSILAGAKYDAPASFSQQTSATAIMGVLGSPTGTGWFTISFTSALKTAERSSEGASTCDWPALGMGPFGRKHAWVRRWTGNQVPRRRDGSIRGTGVCAATNRKVPRLGQERLVRDDRVYRQAYSLARSRLITSSEVITPVNLLWSSITGSVRRLYLSNRSANSFSSASSRHEINGS